MRQTARLLYHTEKTGGLTMSEKELVEIINNLSTSELKNAVAKVEGLNLDDVLDYLDGKTSEIGN